jgi:predicted ATP-grasp superfamily ATP-dependent carboligase
MLNGASSIRAFVASMNFPFKIIFGEKDNRLLLNNWVITLNSRKKKYKTSSIHILQELKEKAALAKAIAGVLQELLF